MDQRRSRNHLPYGYVIFTKAFLSYHSLRPDFTYIFKPVFPIISHEYSNNEFAWSCASARWRFS